MKQRLCSLIILSLALAGCASNTMTEPETADKKKESIFSQSTTISEEEFKKIPKDLRPEELEQRDDTTVVIRSGDKRTIKEYRIGGFLYAIQVVPKVGPPYFLVAADNQGNFIRSDKPEMLIPSWTIFEWD